MTNVLAATPFDPHELLAQARLGVLATVRADGRPRLSPVMPYYDRRDGLIYVSTNDTTAKVANLRRDPRAALEVTAPDELAWATADGTAALAGHRHAATIDRLEGHIAGLARSDPRTSPRC